MKKSAIIAFTLVLTLLTLTGCRSNVPQGTSAPTSRPTTAPTTMPTTPSTAATTPSTEGMGGSDSTGSTGGMDATSSTEGTGSIGGMNTDPEKSQGSIQD